MTVDSHIHLIPEPAKQPWITDALHELQVPFGLEQIHELLQANEIDGCVLVQADHSVPETEMYLRAAAENSWIRGVVGYVQLTDPFVKWRLERLQEIGPKLVGIRHILHDQRDPRFCLQKDFLLGLQEVQGADLAYDLLIKPEHLQPSLELVSHPRLSDLTWVIDHIAKPQITKAGIPEFWKAGMTALAETRRRIFVKLSGMVTESKAGFEPPVFYPYLDFVAEVFGLNRIMFGSDSPVWRLAVTGYDMVLEIITSWMSERSLSDGEKDMIMGLNAVEAYNLQE